MDFNQGVADALAKLMRDMPEAKPGKMFGMPGYMVNGKLAVGVFKDTVVVKLGSERAKALIGKQGIGTFEPMPGRAWKDWVAISSDLQKHRALLEEAVRYVAENS
ncbi:MAG: hypothetical protein ABI700_33565 [Chloroflexota bacterium]